MFDLGSTGTTTEPLSHPTRRHDDCPVLAELRAIATQRRQLDAREAELLAAAHANRTAEHTTGHTLATWWAHTNGAPIAAARTKVRVAVRLAEHCATPLRHALTDEHISWHHIAAFHRAANPRIHTNMCELLPQLIDLAQLATFDRWHTELRGIAEQLDHDGGHDPATDPASNHLHLTPLIDGLTHISGTLAGEIAATIRALIDAGTDDILNRYRRDTETLGHPPHQLPSRAQAAAEALSDLLQAGAAVPTADRSVLRPDVIAIWDQRDNTLTDPHTNPIPLDMLRFIIAAAIIHPLEVSHTGDPLRMGRTLRYANRHQRRALTIRDGGCIFPACTAPARHCDAHHVDHWDHGGPTDIDNMALLCRHHHRVTHRPQWIMARWTDTDEPHRTTFTWTTPTGHTIHSQRHHTQLHTPTT